MKAGMRWITGGCVVGLVALALAADFASLRALNRNMTWRRAHRAIRENDLKRLARCLDEEPQLLRDKRDGFTLLIDAVENERPQVVRLLLDRGADVSETDAAGWTPLHVAARGSTWDSELSYRSVALQLLVNAGADLNVRHRLTGATPLHLACRGGYAETTRLLIRLGADPNATDAKGRTAMHFAAAGQNADLARLLVDGGAAVNAADRMGRTPLHVAARYRDYRFVEVLLSLGADMNAAAADGRTPLAVAESLANNRIIALLELYGAKSRP